jgi:A/G-specific adenine glycosylase
MPSPFPAARRRALRRRLLDWYARHRRDLPWRRTGDPYRIWLSEAMLQQTRVETVLPYYERFIARFPDIQSLADADEQDVLKAWEGLGYYSRARNLKRAAEQVVTEHAGQLPSDAAALDALPGIGPYTSGAIRSIAFGQAAPVVDGNVKRVLSRWLAEPELTQPELWQVAGALVPGAAPGDFNQDLMELGATVCLPRAPLCLPCPVRPLCAAAASGRPEDFPARRKRDAVPEVRALSGVLRTRREDRLLMLRRPSKGLLGGLWEIPSVAGDATEPLLEQLQQQGIRVVAREPLGEVRHVFTHRALTLRVVALEQLGGRLRPGTDPEQTRWCTRAEIEALPLSRLMHKVLALVDASAS